MDAIFASIGAWTPYFSRPRALFEALALPCMVLKLYIEDSAGNDPKMPIFMPSHRVRPWGDIYTHLGTFMSFPPAKHIIQRCPEVQWRDVLCIIGQRCWIDYLMVIGGEIGTFHTLECMNTPPLIIHYSIWYHAASIWNSKVLWPWLSAMIAIIKCATLMWHIGPMDF